MVNRHATRALSPAAMARICLSRRLTWMMRLRRELRDPRCRLLRRSTSENAITPPALGSSASLMLRGRFGSRNSVQSFYPRHALRGIRTWCGWPGPLCLRMLAQMSTTLRLSRTAGSYSESGEGIACGWGVTVDSPHADTMLDAYGNVSVLHYAHWSVDKLSNNVAEVVAIVHNLVWAMVARPGILTIAHESAYAHCMAAGLWRPRTNHRLVLHALRTFTDAIWLGLDIPWVKVESHTGHRGNTRADNLVELGARVYHRALATVGSVPAVSHALLSDMGRFWRSPSTL